MAQGSLSGVCGYVAAKYDKASNTTIGDVQVMHTRIHIYTYI